MQKEINFNDLQFNIQDEIISINGEPFVEVQIAGENKDSHFGSKMIKSSESKKLRYINHNLMDNLLIIEQQSDLINVKSYFTRYENTNAITIYNEITNIANEDAVLEEISSFVLPQIFDGNEDLGRTYLYKFTQSHHKECQPRKSSLFDLGLCKTISTSQKRVNGVNVGSWSTKEELPQGILEYNDKFLMFQIESNNSWYYEISDNNGKIYLYLGGANEQFGGFYKKLKSKESYKTVTVSICRGDSINGVVGQVTNYRRVIKGCCNADDSLPTIFNEYMHLSWDSPTEENTRKIAPVVANLGVKYYVIDCGWHNEEKGSEVYPYVGQWKESKSRFPSGIRATTDYLRSLGLKAGLWIEPEIIGYKCQDMLDYYDEDCFITRHGKKVCTMGRYFLDYRNEKVVDYMTKTIRRMVEDYGADYIKMDYNEDLGIGTDKESDSFGEGLEQCSKAYLDWIENIRRTFPNVLFETCSSGGMRMDYETLKHFSIISTSDQTDYKKYPYIASNILSAVLPEQAAVWSYPVDTKQEIGVVYTPTREWVEENISNEQIIMNMINSFLGRMHLASHIELLSSEKQQIVKDGIEYYDKLSLIKKEALPYFPQGFSDFSKNFVMAGLKYKDKIYLAVWNLGGNKKKAIRLNENVKKVIVAYPINETVETYNNEITIQFTQDYSARFLEIDI